MDKAVTKLLLKAKKAGQKLMEKLGIGKDENAPDERTLEEKRKDLKDAIAKGEEILKSDISIGDVSKKLFEIKNNYNIKVLELKVKSRTEKEVIYLIHG